MTKILMPFKCEDGGHEILDKEDGKSECTYCGKSIKETEEQEKIDPYKNISTG